MILHTTIPQELIFGTDFHQVNEKMIQYNGVNIAVEALNENEWRINKVVSTNPYDYLNTNISPGTIISIL